MSGLHRAARRMALLLLSGLAVANVMPAITMAQSLAVTSALASDPYATHITEAATRFRLPAVWIRAVMRTESAGDPRAISSKGAMGLMQIMPATWAELRARHRLGADPYNVRDNIIASSGYIRELLDRYGSPGWIAAYNAGPGRVRSVRRIPRITETQNYVAKTLTNWRVIESNHTQLVPARATPPPARAVWLSDFRRSAAIGGSK